ncbi:hypothetical protein D1872_284550 [compost metagenome]
MCQGNTFDDKYYDFTEQDIVVDDKNGFHINIKRPLKGVYDEKVMISIYSDVLNDLSKKFEDMNSSEELTKEEIREWFHNKSNVDEVIEKQQEGRYEYKSEVEHLKEKLNSFRKSK